MHEPASRDVPPGSTPLRELAHHGAQAPTGVCAWCAELIRRSPASRIWLATGYADLGGYCRLSPDDEHRPGESQP